MRELKPAHIVRETEAHVGDPVDVDGAALEIPLQVYVIGDTTNPCCDMRMGDFIRALGLGPLVVRCSMIGLVPVLHIPIRGRYLHDSRAVSSQTIAQPTDCSFCSCLCKDYLISATETLVQGVENEIELRLPRPPQWLAQYYSISFAPNTG